jgi:hypothetical protein
MLDSLFAILAPSLLNPIVALGLYDSIRRSPSPTLTLWSRPRVSPAERAASQQLQSAIAEQHSLLEVRIREFDFTKLDLVNVLRQERQRDRDRERDRERGQETETDEGSHLEYVFSVEKDALYRLFLERG